MFTDQEIQVIQNRFHLTAACCQAELAAAAMLAAQNPLLNIPPTGNQQVAPAPSQQH